MHSENHSQPGRQTFLGLFLGMAGLILFLIVLIFISGGFFLYVMLFGGAIGLVALLHYVLWGKFLADEVAGEREEEKLLERARAEDWPLTNGHAIRR